MIKIHMWFIYKDKKINNFLREEFPLFIYIEYSMNEMSSMVDRVLHFQFDKLTMYYENVFLMEDLIHLMIDYY